MVCGNVSAQPTSVCEHALILSRFLERHFQIVTVEKINILELDISPVILQTNRIDEDKLAHNFRIVGSEGSRYHATHRMADNIRRRQLQTL